MKLFFWKKSGLPKEKFSNDRADIVPIVIKLISGLIVLGLVINFVLLFLLNSKIIKMKEEIEVIFETMNRTASIMDKNSGTSYAKNITPESLKNKETFQQSASLITKQAANLIKERDYLAKTLSSVSALLEPATQQKESSLTDISSYEKSSNSVVETIKKSLDSNNKLSSFIADTADKFQVSIPERDNFINSSKTNIDQTVLKTVSDALTNNVEQVTQLKQEVTQKDSKISELNDTIKANQSEKGNTDLKKLFNEQRKELEQLKNDYEELKSEAAQYAAEEEEDTDLQDIKEASESADVQASENRTSYPEYYYKLTGSVVEFNSKWNFVIINIGSDSKMTLDIDGNQREVTVPVPAGQEIYIARGDQFIAKAKIVNVYGKYSVANVIFPVNDKIQKGDSVFFDQPNSNN
ncbi:MAG TPA: hypothetical protein DD381_03755 [Lentisphaeria bacterium]|nr:MAG: hypothetical protein A2X47_06875 [Lentisphaerae bacterium GWF2_38_69]HBM15447.1 hypothetical protein [Lentisphaeria bacterium]